LEHTDRVPHTDSCETAAQTPNHSYDTDAHEIWTTGAVEWVHDAHDHL